MDKQTKRRVATITNYQTVFSSEAGKRVLWDLMKEGNILNVTHVPLDSHSSAFHEGKRSVILYILNKMKTDIKKLEQMLEHAQEFEQLDI